MPSRAPIDDETRRALDVISEHWRTAPKQEDHDFDYNLPLVEAPESVYRPPSFLASTASRRTFQEYADLLAELREFNRLFVGELFGAAALQAHEDPEGWFLIRSFLDWAETYANERVAKRNNRDRSAYHRFGRLSEEFESISCAPRSHPMTLNRLILNPFRWRLRLCAYRATLAPFVDVERFLNANLSKSADGQDVDLEQIMPIPRIPGWDARILERLDVFERLIRLGLVVDSLRTAYTLLQEALPAAPPPRPSRRELQVRLDRTVADLHAIRPFLRWFKISDKATVSAGGELHLHWRWSFGMLGELRIGRPEQLEGKFEPTDRSAARYFVDFDGHPREMPPLARTLEDFEPQERLHFLELHVEALELMLHKLYELWDLLQVARARRLSAREEVNEETEVAEAASRVAQPDGERLAGGRVGALRFNRLCTALERLGVEVRGGKGSEVVLSRGGRLFTLAHHTKNPVIWPGVVRSILRKLEIPLSEFASQAETR